MIIPRTTKLIFNISLSDTDENRTLVKKLGRNIIKQLVVKFEDNEVINPPGTKGFGTHTKHQGGGRKDPPVAQEREMLQT